MEWDVIHLLPTEGAQEARSQSGRGRYGNPSQAVKNQGTREGSSTILMMRSRIDYTAARGALHFAAHLRKELGVQR